MNNEDIQDAPQEVAANDSETADAKGGSKWFLWTVVLVAMLLIAGFNLFSSRYISSETTPVRVRELSHLEYPDDPSGRHVKHSQYDGRHLSLVQVDERHFDFVFESRNPNVAKVVFKNVDVSLMTPSLPETCKKDRSLRIVALTDREWNRQQVHFYRDGDTLEVSGGDGWEEENLQVGALAKNCLNAGLWEVLLFTKDETGKQMYYQGWFTFPMGHYKRLWEQNTQMSYWNDNFFWRMEHWVDPEGTPVDLELLRDAESMTKIDYQYDPEESIWYCGEQVRKRRTTKAPGVRQWGEFVSKRQDVRFATFRPPGVYDGSQSWGNRYELIAQLEGVRHRRVRSTLDDQVYDEIVLEFESASGKPIRFIVGGLSLDEAPTLSKDDYHKGIYMPMGIGTPPFYQDYKDLVASPPHASPYYSFFLDGDDGWLDHHSMAVDGPVIHRDSDDPSLVHLYLLSYERHQIVMHLELKIPAEVTEAD